MAKKPTSLDAIMSSAVANAAPVENSEAETSQPVTIPVAQSSGRSPQTKSITMYTSPQGLKKLKGIALEGDTKVNSIVREALDKWLRENGHGGLEAIEG